MYIQPSSNLKLYSGVPLDNTYEHTLYFKNVQEQNNYFHGTNINIVKSYADFTYIRVNKNKIRVPVTADLIYNVNYLAFRNTNFGTKWFYAFVTSIEYISNDVSEITFEIDDMQTWFYDKCVLKECYVEREHVSDDNVVNKISEPQLTEMIYSVQQQYNVPNNYYQHKTLYLLIATSDYQVSLSKIHNYVINGQQFFGYAFLGNAQQIKTVYEKFVLNTTQDRIKVFKLTNELFTNIQVVNDEDIDSSVDISEYMTVVENANELVLFVPSQTFKMPSPYPTAFPNTSEGYIPKNNKCYTAPFQVVTASNNHGQENVYCPQLFKGGSTPEFSCVYDVSFNDELLIAPNSYSEHDGVDYDKAIFSKGSLDLEVFGSDFNLRKTIKDTTNMIGYVTNTDSASKRGLAYGNTIISTLGEALVTEPTATIPNNDDGLLTKLRVSFGTELDNNSCLPFKVEVKQVLPQIIKIYDDFFTKYGYACMRVKHPNISSRPKWNYIKTRGCIIVGEAPVDSIQHICSIFDKGITFWKSASDVGNYSLDNKPV